MKKNISKIPNQLTLLSIVVVGMLLIVTGLLYSSFALQEPVRSISFTSEKLNYNEKEPGSWKVEKSAKWISRGKARITFDVDTVLKTENKNRDIIFVLDISSSMSGDKLAKVKSDSIELINSLLSDSKNSAALITFDTESKILSNFTNNSENLVSSIAALNESNCTNYYQALINVDTILKNYKKEKDKDCIVLFLTDGYPNEDVPNEESYFQYLKKEYPYIVVNGIQYEMGEDILEPIKNVSDHQFIADMKTLNNVLFDASVIPVPYEKFVLTDYIDTDNFYVESIDNIKASHGKVDFDEKEQKITWIIESLRTGSNPTMTIDVVQKEESKSKELVSTNKKEEVISKIEAIEEQIESDKTPILKNIYQVIYEGNAPSNCTISNIPETKNHSIFDIVEIDRSIPTCEKYQFKGWRIVADDVKRISSDYFEMPEKDVILIAEWSGLSLTKSMDGEINKYIPPVLRKASSSDGSDIWRYKSSVTKVVFQDEIKNIPEATETFDMSEGKNYGVVGYLVPNSDNTSTYTAYIQGDGGIIANSDSSNLFYNFSKLEAIEGLEYLDTSNVTNMYQMFSACYSLINLDLSSFDTSNVTNMSYMFSSYRDSSTMKLETLNLSGFDTSNVTDMRSMFWYCRNLKSLDLNDFDTSRVTNMRLMFEGCINLESLNVSSFDTSVVTDMESMFSNCNSLTSLDVSSFNTSSVTNMKEMFLGCKNLTILNVSNFNTSNVTNMGSMFRYCTVLISLDLSSFDTSNVTDMSWMVANSNKLTTINLSSFNTENVKLMGSMFSECSSLTDLDVSNFNTSKVIDIGSMFYNCSSLISLDISNFDTSAISAYMGLASVFSGCTNLKNLKLCDFVTTEGEVRVESMFKNCKNLTTTVNIYNPNFVGYNSMFDKAATSSDAKIIVNYIMITSDLVDKMIATKSSNSNVVKGNLMGYDITIVGNSDIQSNPPKAMKNNVVTLSSISKDYMVTSFKMNGTLINGNEFVMPEGDVVVTDIITSVGVIIDSPHYPYSLPLSDSKTFEGATSLTVTIDYEIKKSRDYIYLYDSREIQYGKYEGSTRKQETLTIQGNYIRVELDTDSFYPSGSLIEYYGFKVVVIPNYEPLSTITISGNNDIESSLSSSLPGELITLSSKTGNYMVTSFEMNGTLMNGNEFTMPDNDVIITNLNTSEGIIIDSEHNPYPTFLHSKVYGEKIFEGATSLTITLDYETESISNDYVYLYDSVGKEYGKYGGSSRKQETIKITGNYIKITFTTNKSNNNYYGFKAKIVPSYDPLPTITISDNDSIQSNFSSALPGETIILSSINENYLVTSFKMNGTLVEGNSFIMPDKNVTITDIVSVESVIIESEHTPYPNSLNSKVYGEKTFEGATSLTVTLDYQTESTSYDWVYLYDSSGTQYGKYGGTTKKTETITIPGNYIKVVFRTDSSGNNYYGFKATVIPNYD